MNSAMTHLSLEANLKVLRLPTFLREYEGVAKESVRKNASYEDFLRDLSEKEVINKQSNAIQKRIKQAQFPVLKTLEAFDFEAAPKLNKKLVLDLAQGDFLERHENIIALGNSGTGKTHIATSIGLRACQLGKSVFFIQASHLVHQLLEAQEERRLLKLKKKLLSYDLLVIDELGFVPFSKTGAELLFGNHLNNPTLISQKKLWSFIGVEVSSCKEGDLRGVLLQQFLGATWLKYPWDNRVHLENQGAFLKSLGIEMRTQTLQQKAQDLKTKNNLQLSTDRLIAPDQMGALFKVLQLKTWHSSND